MKVADLHSWDVSPAGAREIQDELRGRVELVDAIRMPDIRVVAGVDNAYSRASGGGMAYAVVVVMSYPELAPLEVRYGSSPITFPYVPGLLTFREAPAVLAAFRQVETVPDVVLFDGQGLAHFRRFGLASHLGVVLGLPSIGCAKTRLTGSFAEPGEQFGDWTPLEDRGEEIGAAVRTRPGHAPLFVSPGTMVSVATGVEIVLSCCRDNHFIPEPTRHAHRLVTAYRKERAVAVAARPGEPGRSPPR